MDFASDRRDPRRAMDKIPSGGEPPGFPLLALVGLIAVICLGLIWAWLRGGVGPF
jgi:hypothetical protein